MSRFYFNLALLLISLFSVFASVSVQADQTTVINTQGQPVIVTTVPAPKESIATPQGYVNCFTVPAGWNYNNIWVAEHKVCQYTPNNGSATQGVAWVDGYWACIAYKNAADIKQGECTDWQWQTGHWVKTLEVY